MKSTAVVLIVLMAVATGYLELKRHPERYGPFIPDWVELRGPGK